MKKNNFSVLFFFLIYLSIFISSSFANENLNTAEKIELKIDHEISFGVNIGDNPSVNYFNVFSHYVPKEVAPHQDLKVLDSNYKDNLFVEDTQNPKLNYRFDETNLESKMNIDTTFTVVSVPQFPKISQSSSYPYPPSEIYPYGDYLEFTELIDTNEELRKKAFELVGDEDDVYIIATTLANWVQNEIEYDLSTVFLNPDQKATEIYESKKGVCKELSIIYSSMLRSLQIPTRMVVGYSYTNSNEIIDFIGSNWGGHAWVEVYIDGQWVPFDLTYQQYGYVDATHIAFQHTPDITELGIQVESSTVGITLKDRSLKSDFDFNVVDSSGTFDPIIVESSLTTQTSKVAPTSIIRMSATIENDKSYYQVIPIKLLAPEEVEILSDDSQIIILKPKEVRNIDFFVKMPNLNRYLFPFTLYSRNRELANQTIELNSRNEYIDASLGYEEQRNKEIAKANSVIDKTKFSTTLSYNCNISQSSNLNMLCEVYNLPNNFNSIELCSTLDCTELTKSELDSNNGYISTSTLTDSAYIITIDDTSLPLEYKHDIPELNYSINIVNTELLLESLINKNDENYRITFNAGINEVSVNSKKKKNSTYLKSGSYTGSLKYYYFDELVENETIKFTVSKETFWMKVDRIIVELLDMLGIL